MYRFHVGGLLSDQRSCTCLILQTASKDTELRVRLTSADAQELAVSLAGAPSAPARLAKLIGQLAQQFDAALSHVQLSRSAGAMIDAVLSLTTTQGGCEIPVTFSDGMTLAIVHHLPIYGDATLAPLLKTAPPSDIPLPAALTAFLNALPDE